MGLPETKKLGFGLMRLPKIGEEFDKEQINKMIDIYMEAGFNYFDTAYVYAGSEAVTKEVLVNRYPRESYTLATKINANMGTVKNRADCEEYFQTQLDRTGAGYFDFYLLHAISSIENYENYKNSGVIDFVDEMKEKGLIRHNGFSFHGDPETLEYVLDRMPQTEFVQLQINYADWDSDMIFSGKLYDIVRARNIPIIIMEPVKGGSLANITDDIKAVFDKASPGKTAASWALRYAGSLDGVHTILSGMSNIEQTAENIEIFGNFKPLDDAEKKAVDKVVDIMYNSNQILCTDCKYCVEGCPKNIDIPLNFKLANSNRRLPGDGMVKMFVSEFDKESSAAACIGCKKCEKVCPQHLPIVDYLKEVAEEFARL